MRDDGTAPAESLRLGAGDALFLDFDGTLADLGPDPDAVFAPREVAAALTRLATRLGGALAVVSGRGVADLARRTPAGLWRIGAHGIEVAAPGEVAGPPTGALPAAALAPLETAARRPGVRLELKGRVAALHYRAAPEAEADCLAAAEAARAAGGEALTVQAGKMVVEVKPAGADKGEALRRAMRSPPFAGRRPVFAGDDATDEDAIAAALALGGVGIKVGPGETRAGFRAATPEAFRRWLLDQIED